MKSIISALLWAGFAMPVLDGFWLSFMSTRSCRPKLGDLLAAEFQIAPTLAFCAIHFFGVCAFRQSASRANVRKGKSCG